MAMRSAHRPGARALVAAICLALPGVAGGTTPALWLRERARCLVDQTDRARVADLARPDRRLATRKAAQVLAACRATIPADQFTVPERRRIEREDLPGIVRDLRARR